MKTDETTETVGGIIRTAVMAWFARDPEANGDVEDYVLRRSGG